MQGLDTEQVVCETTRHLQFLERRERERGLKDFWWWEIPRTICGFVLSSWYTSTNLTV